MTQYTLPLYDPPGEVTRLTEPRSGYTHRGASSTEVEAAIRVRGRSGKRRKQVMECIAAAGPKGATRHEVSERTGIPLQSVCSIVFSLLEPEFVETHEGLVRDKRQILCATERGKRAVQS
jgi:hypothetical protein